MKLHVGKRNKAGNDPARRQVSNAPASRPTDADLSNRYAFRRNRTLTGSSSAKVASTNELNSELRSPRAHVHHLTALRRKLLTYFVAVSAVAFCLYLLVAQLVASVSVQVASVAAVSAADQEAFERSFETYYAARPVERLRFMLNTPELLSHIQATQPEVKSITVQPGGNLGEASVRVVARTPIARWSSGNSQYVDNEGVVFAKNYFSDPELQIVDNSGLGAASNRLVASNRFLGFVGRVIAGSSRTGLTIDKVTIPALTTRQITVSLEGKRTEYKLSIDRSAGAQVEDVSRVERYLTSKNLQPSYVDIRLEEKAFYK